MSTEPIFSLGHAIVLLQRALEEAQRLNGTEVPVSDEHKIRRGDPVVSAALRDVLHLSHLCERARDEVSRAYWAGRGYPDPLDGPPRST